MLFAAFRSKQVTKFLGLSKNILKTYHLIYLNFGKDSQLNADGLKELRNLKALKTNQVILFLDATNMELAMDIVSMFSSQRQ